jgi:hypothetical protein
MMRKRRLSGVVAVLSWFLPFPYVHQKLDGTASPFEFRAPTTPSPHPRLFSIPSSYKSQIFASNPYSGSTAFASVMSEGWVGGSGVNAHGGSGS